MIVEQDKYAVTSTVPQANRVQMAIRAEDMGHIMGLLAGAYADKRLAIVREYSTNAFDAHTEASVARPIEVNLPTALTPFLTIRDFGSGMDETDIAEVYSQYGRSTKRESNQFNGALGIGCKSALAYGTQFTVSSVKPGITSDGITGNIETVVIVSREEDGSGSMTPMTAGLTDKPTGTEVRIPINRSDFGLIAEKAQSLYAYWPEGSVLLDGAAPKRLTGLKITDTIQVVESGGPRVVMGNVPYPAPELSDLGGQGNVVAYVPIGAVTFPPSREALGDTKQTRATLAQIREDYKHGVNSAIQREVDAADDPASAIRVAARFSGMLRGRVDFTGIAYKGDTLPVNVDAFAHGASNFIWSTCSSYRLGASSTPRIISGQNIVGTCWVENFSPGKFTALHKRKLNKAVESHGSLHAGRVHNPDPTIDYVEQYVCIPGTFDKSDPAFKFVNPALILDWDVVRKIQLQARASRGSSGRIPGSYDLYTEAGYQHGVEGDKIRRDCPILYLRGNRYGYRRFEKAVAANFPKFTVVLLSENRVAKWNRIVPESKTVQQALNDVAAEWVKGLSTVTKRALAQEHAGFRCDFGYLDAAKVKDPTLKDAIQLAKMPIKSKLSRKRELESFARVDLGVIVANPLSRYPLWDGGKPTDHVYAYLNWAFEAGV